MPEVCRTSVFYKNLGTYHIFAKILQNIADLHNFWRLSVLCKNLAKDLHPQEPCKVSMFSEKSMSSLSFRRILQDNHCLQESQKLSIVCKNLAGYILFKKIMRENYYLQGCRHICHICNHLARKRLHSRRLNYVYWLQASCSLTEICKTLECYISLAKSLKVSFYLQHSRKISLLRNAVARYLLVARILQDTFYSEESHKMSFTCKILSRSLIFARILQDISFCLQEFRNKSYSFRNVSGCLIFCKSHAKYVIFERNTKDILFLKTSCKVSFLRRNLAEFLAFPIILQDFYCLPEPSRTSVICKKKSCKKTATILKDVHYLQAFRKKSKVCNNFERYLLLEKFLQETVFFARISEDAYWLQEFCNNFIRSKNFARNPLVARTLPVNYFAQG